MATQLIYAVATIPAGTPQNAPVTVDVSFSPMVTELIRWRVPRGAQGVMGWQLTSSGAQVIPANLGAFVIAAGDAGTWQLDQLHDSGDWHVTGYNTGAFPHNVHLEFAVSPIRQLARPGARYGVIVGLAAAAEAVQVNGSAYG